MFPSSIYIFFNYCITQLCFFSPFIFISWRLITLQYCSGFCHTLKWISHGQLCFLNVFSSLLLNFLLCTFVLLLCTLNNSVIIILNSLSDRLLIYTFLSSFRGFHLVPSFQMYYCIGSFCLILCFHFYVLDSLALFPNFWEVTLCREIPIGLSITLFCGHQRYML